MTEATAKKLEILAESAKYDVSCASSGTTRKHEPGKVGNAHGLGICHSFTEDGRCVSLLKVMMTNHCIYDCAYCVNRRSNDRPRATLTVDELVTLTMEFYRRNYIEGLFLSSGVVVGPDHTMERMVRVVKELRTTHRYNGYIHMKSIPGAGRELVHEAGLYADRLSVNIEIPTEQGLKLLAPDKNYTDIYRPMTYIHQGILQIAEDRKRFRNAPRFTPAGQSTQMIVGASGENDSLILRMSSALYAQRNMKRVYYSGFIPVNSYDPRLPALKQPPLVRENRLYQADWLMRFYGFGAAEIVDDAYPDLDLEIDPKLSWALRHPEFFPVDLNRADYEIILRVPGIGVKSAKMIVAARRHARITPSALKKIGVVMKKAQYFIVCNELTANTVNELRPENVRRLLTPARGRGRYDTGQLTLFPPEPSGLREGPELSGLSGLSGLHKPLELCEPSGHREPPELREGPEPSELCNPHELPAPPEPSGLREPSGLHEPPELREGPEPSGLCNPHELPAPPEPSGFREPSGLREPPEIKGLRGHSGPPAIPETMSPR